MGARRVAVFVGTRPEAIKLAPVVRRLRADAAFEAVVISSGQHREMLQQVIDLFGIHIDQSLDVMVPNQSLSGLTGKVLCACDQVLAELRPDAALVQGDTTTVLAASLACFYQGVPIGHVEAGLRTGDMQAPFPEEANRVLASRLARWHFAPTERARDNLLREGILADGIFVTGNTVIDALKLELERQRQPEIRAGLHARLAASIGPDWSSRPFVLVTGHRRENFGRGFAEICSALVGLAQRFPQYRFIYPVHLNPNVQGPVYDRLGRVENIRLIQPQPYDAFVALMAAARLLLTDSGGVQEEAPSLGKPVLVMREATERPEGVEAGTVRLVGAHAASIVDAVGTLLTDEVAYRRMAQAKNPYGDGTAAVVIADVLGRALP